MKKMLTVALVAAISSSAFFAASEAQAQASATAAKPATAASVAKPAAAHSASAAKTASGAHVVKRKIIKKKSAVVAAAKKEAIPEGADKWSCAEGQALFIKGDMKRDQILTLYYEGKSFQLPRRDTTTGADRFYDMASGMDLVVIPTKAMLFSDKEDDRLADECKTDAMIHQNELAPTQSNALLNR